MIRHLLLLIIVLLGWAALVPQRHVARADAPDIFWRQEDPKFGITQKYCLYTGNSMIQTAATKAFNDIDAHFGGVLNPVQFAPSCNLDWSYWVDENAGDCGASPPILACASLGPSYWDGLHSHTNPGQGGHVGVNVSYWIWDYQGSMNAVTAQELLHLWGLNHVLDNCSHPHPSAMSPANVSGSHVTGTTNCTGATGVMSGDLGSLDSEYSSSYVPLFARLVPNGWNPSYGNFVWYADPIHEEAWFSIDRKQGSGSWTNQTSWAARDSSSITDPSVTQLPTRPASGQQEDCWRIKAWANWWSSGYSTVSCIARPGTDTPVDGTLTQYRGYGTSELVGHNLAAESVTIKLYDGLLGFNPTLLTTCTNVAQGNECNYSYAGRGPGYWHTMQVIRSNGQSYAWLVDVN